MDNRNQSSLEAQNYASDIGNYPIKVVALGGLDEMGKNCYVIEVDNDAFIIEAGLKYPNASIPGVDIIIPDFDYIRTIAKKVRAILITHGHDDQYGALPYLLNIVRAPIYATETTIQVIKTTLSPRFRKIDQYSFVKVDPSDTVTINGHVFELFQTTHSVAESFGFALKTRFGNIVYTSDFMSDYSPLKGFQFDLPKVARLSESEKTFLLMTESESADKNGIASPRHKITPLVQSQFEEATGKTFVSLFYQNFYNIQEIINLAIKYKKKVCIANPDQIPFFDRMAQIGDLVIPNEMRISASEISQNASKDVVVLVTGSGDQLYKYCKEICYGSVNGIHVDTKDTWIDAAPSVPGTEVSYTDASDTIFRTDCKVITLNRKSLVSMHAQEEDLKMMISLFRPKYYMPVKGEFRLLMANAKLAIDLGIGLNHFNTFVYDNGMALAFDNQGKVVRKMIVVKNGDVMVDGTSVGDVKEAAIDERQKMADGGVVLIGIALSLKKRKIVCNPDIQMRGFIYLRDSEPIVNQISSLAVSTINGMLQGDRPFSLMDLEKKAADKVSKMVYKATNKEPMINVKIINADQLSDIDPR